MLTEERIYKYSHAYVLNALHDTFDMLDGKIIYSNPQKSIYKIRIKGFFNIFLVTVKSINEDTLLRLESKCFFKSSYIHKKNDIDKIFSLFESIISQKS